MKTMNLNVATANVMNGYVEAKKFFYKTHKRYPNNGELNTFIKNNNEKSLSRVLSLSPLIFSLTALNRSKIKELEELLKDSYKVFKPCCFIDENSSCSDDQISTCIFVKKVQVVDSGKTLDEYFEPIKSNIFERVFPHKKDKTKFCNARECRIQSEELNLEIASFYVKSGIGQLNAKARESLYRVIDYMKTSLNNKSRKSIILTDLNCIVPDFTSSKSLEEYQKKFPQTWNAFNTELKELYEIINAFDSYVETEQIPIATHGDYKIDFILSNIEDTLSSKTIDNNSSDHKIVCAEYLLKAFEK